MQPPCNLCALLYDETPHQDAQSLCFLMFRKYLHVLSNVEYVGILRNSRGTFLLHWRIGSNCMFYYRQAVYECCI